MGSAPTGCLGPAATPPALSPGGSGDAMPKYRQVWAAGRGRLELDDHRHVFVAIVDPERARQMVGEIEIGRPLKNEDR